jgi:hypothetical protein
MAELYYERLYRHQSHRSDFDRALEKFILAGAHLMNKGSYVSVKEENNGRRVVIASDAYTIGELLKALAKAHIADLDVNAETFAEYDYFYSIGMTDRFNVRWKGLSGWFLWVERQEMDRWQEQTKEDDKISFGWWDLRARRPEPTPEAGPGPEPEAEQSETTQ